MRDSTAGRAERPDSLGGLVDSMTLLAVLEEAVPTADAAERLLTRCDAGTRLSPADARAGLHLRYTFAQLSRWLEGLDLPPRDEEVRDETSRLLAFYLHMLTHALDARFAVGGRDGLVIRSRGPLTGLPCRRLELLRVRVRERNGIQP
jgi:hypothetical protein